MKVHYSRSERDAAVRFIIANNAFFNDRQTIEDWIDDVIKSLPGSEYTLIETGGLTINIEYDANFQFRDDNQPIIEDFDGDVWLSFRVDPAIGMKTHENKYDLITLDM